jgi:hypothetical protein
MTDCFWDLLENLPDKGKRDLSVRQGKDRRNCFGCNYFHLFEFEKLMI